MRGMSLNAWDDQIVTPYGLHDDLAAAAAMWQTRAAHLEDQLKQLAPGEIVPETTPEPPESTEMSGSVLQGLRTWLRRLWPS